MIYIHPTATHNFNSLVALKQATGLTISRGKRYLCLIPDDDEAAPPAKQLVVYARRAGKTAHLASYMQGPFFPDGGSAA